MTDRAPWHSRGTSLRDLTGQLGDAARDLGSEDVARTLDRAVSLAVELIDGCDGAGVCLVRRGVLETPVCSAEFVARGDALQHELQEGPCMDAGWEQQIVVSSDLAKEERWPTWGPRVVEELGVRSMMCIQLFVEENALGVLNMYSTQQAAAFTRDEDRYEGQALAAHVAVALVAAQEIEHLNHALLSRTLIAQAEGILMERFDISAARAFEVLKRISSHSQIKVYRVAEEIVRTRQIPTGQVHGPVPAHPTGTPTV